jgi:glycerol kinase
LCDDLSDQGFAEMIREKTGLILDAYFSASKIQWILKSIEGGKRLAEQGHLAFGTIDSWLVWKLTNGRVHMTDVTNASRTLLFDIHTQQWDAELCKLFEVPMQMLPAVSSSDTLIATTERNILGVEIPIAGVIGDQHASMFGHACFDKGTIKNTYGSGCFLMMNIGTEPLLSKHHLITTIAWRLKGVTTYALEASVFGGSSTFRWLRDGLGIIDQTADAEQLAQTEKDNGGVYFVPAFSGLGSPYWDSHARGLIIGISRGTTAGHIARASLEGVALGICDAVEAMEKETGANINEVKVDGSSVAYPFLLQLQANLLMKPVIKPDVIFQSTMGAAFIAGLSIGFWTSLDEIKSFYRIEQEYTAQQPENEVNHIKKFWKKAINRSMRWY